MFKILVAEDEKKTRDALCTRLQVLLGENGVAESAEDGNDAVSKALRFQPQLILMDIEMPFKNGLEAAEIIKKQLPDTQVVFLTAYDRFDYAVDALRMGAKDYLLKPASEESLRRLLEEYFDLPDTSYAASADGQTPFADALAVWLRRHYAEDVTLESAAESMGMSSFYFSRQVKAACGQTFLERLIDYRVHRACRLLCQSALSVGEVGRAVGYPDSNYFAKVFKRVTGVTPSAYRAEGETAD